MVFLLFIIVVALPIGLWLWFIRSSDKSEPEPSTLMRRCFYVGIASCIVASVYETIAISLIGLPEDVLALGASQQPLLLTSLGLLLIAPMEELFKYVVLRLSVYRSHDFNQVFDGIVYGITVALGFSFVENLMYFVHLYTSQNTLPFITITIMRGTISTFGHVTFTAILGYYLGRAKFSASGRGWLVVQGLVFASLLHFIFDFLLSSHFPFSSVLAVAFVAGGFYICVRLWNRPDVRMVWKYVPPPSA
jgi:RsiW-degrading membrane proteinase PrsW (M82 family)